MYGMQVNSQPLPTTDLEKDDRLEREETFFMETYLVTQIRSEERQLSAEDNEGGKTSASTDPTVS